MNKWIVRGILCVIVGGAAWYFVGDPLAALSGLLLFLKGGKSKDDKARAEDIKQANKELDEVKKAKGKKKAKLMDKIFNRNLSLFLFVLLLFPCVSFLCVASGQTNGSIETKVLEAGDVAEETLFCHDNDDSDKLTRLVRMGEVYKKDNERRAKAETRWKIKAWSGTAAALLAVVGAGFKLSDDRDFQKAGNGFLIGSGVVLVINLTI